ncbi:hypothetical protein P4U07_28575 [Bacillus mycoides]|nr:hypothetical protein [Bacillus mycoides]
MPSKSEIKEIYFAMLNDDRTYGELILVKPTVMTEAELFKDSDHATEDM